MARQHKLHDNFSCLSELPGFDGVSYLSLARAEAAGAGPLSRLPYSLRILTEHLLRHQDDETTTAEQIRAMGDWVKSRTSQSDIAFHPQRILMQDSAGLPVLADLVALDETVRTMGGNAAQVEPKLPIDLIVDHSVEVDQWSSATAVAANLSHEYRRNGDRYRFLKWAARHFPNIRIGPPGVGICHQLNLEVISELVRLESGADGKLMAGFDSVLGTDSHTPMVNGLSVLAWGVGGIEAASAALGEPVMMRIPDVIGVRLTGRLAPGVQATDLALSLTARLREFDLVQRFVEFTGPGLDTLSVPDRAPVANMAPEYGATMGFFPPDQKTLEYLYQTGRPYEQIRLVKAFLLAQSMLRGSEQRPPVFTDIIEFDLASVGATVAGPSRPHQRRALADVPSSVPVVRVEGGLDHGAVVIAAITSCTNTSNPQALVTAGLLARNAVAKGLTVKPWTKTSFAPGSLVASQLLVDCGLQSQLDHLGFHLVGHGCTTCMGNSGPLPASVEAEIKERNLAVAAVLSGNRNFEGRIHPQVRLSYLASPALVVAYALAGNMHIDLSSDPLGTDAKGNTVRLADLWPSPEEIETVLAATNQRSRFLANRAKWLQGGSEWDGLAIDERADYRWDGEAGFIRRPPFLLEYARAPLLDGDIIGARTLVLLEDGITTDHISPVSRINAGSPAAAWLGARGVPPAMFGSFSSRRLNHDVMLRGGFANPRLRNLLVPQAEGGVTKLMPEGEVLPIFAAAARYAERGTPVVVVAGRNYGAGSARDWAAKVTRLLGVRAVIAGSFERIHRANLVSFGILPLELPEGALLLSGNEELDLLGLPDALHRTGSVILNVREGDRIIQTVKLRCRIETKAEERLLRSGGLFAKLLAEAAAVL